ncbi:MAG TPA: CAP domain-containing protein, partial [Polyangiaceae bacterium]|nr:CAP domain-containing protein [Polyangiaceae bacterium]
STGQLRCGIAQARAADGREAVVAVAVDALADLEPLPVRARLGQWWRLQARVLAPARSAEIVLLGPRGAPRSVPTELRPGEARAVFSLDQMGLWRIQLLLDTDAGPRPALEAWAFVDAEPSWDAAGEAAPGESLARAVPDADAGALLDMLNAARRSEQRPPLRRDARLDELAQAHAEAMRQRRRTAHDVGDGSPVQRLEQAGFDARRVGENVAHARSLGRAHRALWESPAHRGNLLDAGFASVGLGVVVVPESVAEDDTERGNAEAAGVWVCELFAN